jgi:hypothetical protein
MIKETLSLLRLGDTAFPPSERLGGSERKAPQKKAPAVGQGLDKEFGWFSFG